MHIHVRTMERDRQCISGTPQETEPILSSTEQVEHAYVASVSRHKCYHAANWTHLPSLWMCHILVLRQRSHLRVALSMFGCKDKEPESGFVRMLNTIASSRGVSTCWAQQHALAEHEEDVDRPAEHGTVFPSTLLRQYAIADLHELSFLGSKGSLRISLTLKLPRYALMCNKALRCCMHLDWGH